MSPAPVYVSLRGAFLATFIKYVYLCVMAHFRKVASRITQVVDSETGEILDQTEISKTVKVKDKEQFFTAFSRLVMSFGNLDYAEAKILVWCSMKAELNTAQVTLVKHHKEELAKTMGLTARSVDNSLSKLVRKGYLHRIANSVYMIDPEISWKGIPSERSKQIQVFLTYKIGE